ncbi:MAG: stage III sporulation protein AG [Firmicutes bacterium]|nr:stage III sporulation protein AG [Sporosalibacterium faouarense]MTI48198.1 stage III sporulation protein AG [Bacillota bacterium]
MEFFKKENSKKFLTNLVIILIIGVMILIAASTFMDSDKEKNVTTGNNNNETTSDKQSTALIDDYANNIEKKLKNILGMINGIGEVEVMVTLEDTAEKIPAIDTTESKETTNEKDAQGGTREVIKDDLTKKIVTSNGNGEESLVVIKEIKPSVKGVIVVANGANDPVLKEKIYRAVKTVLGIPGNRVEVFSSN